MLAQGDIGELVGMVVAFIAVIYTIVVTLADLFRQRKQMPQKNPPPQNPPPLPHHEKKKWIEEKEKELLEELFGKQEAEEEEELEEDEYIDEVKRPVSKPALVAVASLPPVPPSSRGWPRVEEKFDFHSVIEGEGYRKKSAIEDRELQVKLRSGDDLVSADLKVWGDGKAQKTQKHVAPIVQMMKQMPDKKLLIICTEIINPPLSLRPQR
ncbi:MAG TPA: hypothetical protein VN457_03940 [Chlamydiales bacterium]|nr:hypothetical protein [Chlamydiales bacterium]